MFKTRVYHLANLKITFNKCKYCELNIFKYDDGSWFELKSRNLICPSDKNSHIHKPVDKEGDFDKLYKRMVL